jgi:hypothetical protein
MGGDGFAAKKSLFYSFVTGMLRKGGVFVAKAPGWV